MPPRSGGILAVEEPALSEVEGIPTRSSTPSPEWRFYVSLPIKHANKKAAREGCLSRASVTCYCAAGLWCTGGFLAAGAAGFISSTPFSMTIMNGLGVYDVGSP
jgi:hypothetical protein